MAQVIEKTELEILSEQLVALLLQENEEMVSYLAKIDFVPSTYGYGRYGEGKFPLLFKRDNYSKLLTHKDIADFCDTFGVTVTYTGDWFIVCFN